MANENNLNDPDNRKDPTRTYIDDRRSPAEIDNDLQVDPEMAEGPASNTRITLFAIGIAVVLGVVFYGLNQSSMHNRHRQCRSTPTASRAQRPAQHRRSRRRRRPPRPIPAAPPPTTPIRAMRRRRNSRSQPRRPTE